MRGLILQGLYLFSSHGNSGEGHLRRRVQVFGSRKAGKFHLINTYLCSSTATLPADNCIRLCLVFAAGRPDPVASYV